MATRHQKCRRMITMNRFHFKMCKRCNINKPLSEYYAHPRMADGHLNFCKDCTKIRVKKYSKTENGILVEKKRRFNIKRREWHREYARNKRVKSPELIKEYQDRWHSKYPKRKYASTVVQRALKKGILKRKPCEICGKKKVEGHHDDYTKPLNVRWLCKLHHMEVHYPIDLILGKGA